jgi:predicted transcriptional regulator
LEQILQKQTRSILDELASIGHDRDRSRVLETRANNVIVSAINLMAHIREHYDASVADELERRLLSSIKNQDPSKFTRKVRGLQEHKESPNETK